MIPYDLQHISFVQIEIFFRCAELKNFTKAATELNITPGMVSKKIAALETALQLPLFIRKNNRVALSKESAELYNAWKKPVESLIASAADLQEQCRKNSTIEVYIWSATNPERFLVPLINAITAENDVPFRIHLNDNPCILDDIVSGKLDIAFIPKFAERGIKEVDNLDCFLALPSPLYAALSADNPLAKKELLRVDDLRDLYLLVEEGTVSWYTDMLKELCQAHGFAARIKVVEKHVYNSSFFYMDPDCAIITDKYIHAFSYNAIEYREIQNTESGLLMIFRKDAPPHIQTLLKYAWNFYKEFR